MRIPLWCAAGLVVLGACRHEAADAGRAASAAVASEPAPAEPGAGDTWVGESDDCSSGIDTVGRHAEPIALVREWVRRNAEGALDADSAQSEWEANAVTCIDRLSTDFAEVLARYDVDSLDVTGDTARAVIRYERAFSYRWDSAGTTKYLVPDSTRYADTAVIVRTRYGWRLDQIAPGLHELPAAALRSPALDSADRERLRVLATHPGA